MTTDVDAVLDREPAPQNPDPAPPAEPIAHLATCAECDVAVTFRPSASGASFTLLGSDQALGIGAHGRPMCPNGHGEMAITDDQRLIDQAISQVVEQLDATTQRLPFPSPPFNYEGALHEIFEKEKANAILEARFNDADERRKKAKGALDDGREELSALIETLQQREQDRIDEIARREARAAAGHPEDTNLIGCQWEAAHPDETCAICDALDEAERRGFGGTARDSAQHVEMADRFGRTLDTDEIVDDVRAAGVIVPFDVVHGWTEDERGAVKEWAEVESGLADPPEGGMPRPACLGTAHVAANSVTSEVAPGDTFQCCAVCGARLGSVKTGSGEDLERYPMGTLVGIDCPGPTPEPARQLPKRGKKKAAKK